MSDLTYHHPTTARSTGHNTAADQFRVKDHDQFDSHIFSAQSSLQSLPEYSFQVVATKSLPPLFNRQGGSRCDNIMQGDQIRMTTWPLRIPWLQSIRSEYTPT